jgi:VanZ family protein
MGMSNSPAPDHRQRGVGHQLSAWIPVAVCVAAIACESTATFGADHTSGPLQRFFEFLLHRQFTQPQWWRLHLAIRKCGHFLGYGILSISWFRAFWMTWRTSEAVPRRAMTAHSLAMLGTLAVASADELHQLYLPNRSGSIVDVMIDCCGGLLMQLVIWLSMRSWIQRPARYSPTE